MPSDRETNKEKKEDEKEVDNIKPMPSNKSLFLFNQENAVRKLMIKIEESKYF